jgi:hypothetical protein
MGKSINLNIINKLLRVLCLSLPAGRRGAEGAVVIFLHYLNRVNE